MTHREGECSLLGLSSSESDCSFYRYYYSPPPQPSLRCTSLYRLCIFSWKPDPSIKGLLPASSSTSCASVVSSALVPIILNKTLPCLSSAFSTCGDGSELSENNNTDTTIANGSSCC
jgi:hypothetical protein